MASLITSYEGWDYFDNGTAISPDGTYFFEGNAVWSPAMSGGDSGAMINGAMGGLSSLFGNLATVAVDTWSKKTLMQQAQDGARYVEGRPVVVGGQYQQGGIPPLFLLAGAGMLFYALVKG